MSFLSRKALSLGFLLAALLVGGWKAVIPSLDTGGASPSAYVAQAASAIGDASLTAAAVSVEIYRSAAGTYSGAILTVPGVTLAWANDTSYCLQAGAGADARHLQGPQGAATPGPCP